MAESSHANTRRVTNSPHHLPPAPGPRCEKSMSKDGISAGLQGVSGEEPPSYNDETVPELVQPATLYAAERFVYSSDPNAPPLYELSHSVGFLSDSDRTVRFERLEHTIKVRAGAPQVTTKNRHLYDLRHPTSGEIMNFEYQGESLSSQSLGSFGIVPFRKHLFGSKGFRVHRATRGADGRLVARDELFKATASKAKNVGFEWTDENGQMLAREVIEDDLMRLVVGMEMSVKMRDALVAAWILRIWNELSRKKGLTGMPGGRYMVNNFASAGEAQFKLRN